MQKAAGEAQAPPKSPTKNFRDRRPKEYPFFTHESRTRGRCGLRTPTNLDRRRFLKTSVAGGAGLLIGFYLPAPGEMLAAPAISAPPAALNAWIHIGTDDIVTIVIDKSEMGQGIMTGLAMLAAEELECDWKNIRTEFAPNDKAYFNP